MDVIKPAVDGTIAVLEACSNSGTVKRVCLTSSIAAVRGNVILAVYLFSCFFLNFGYIQSNAYNYSYIRYLSFRNKLFILYNVISEPFRLYGSNRIYQLNMLQSTSK